MSVNRLSALLLAMVFGTVAALPGLAAEEKKGEKDAAKANPGPGLTQAQLAIQLAMEGQKRKSPTLMLAAVELLGGLKEAKKSADDVKSEAAGGSGKSDKKPLSMNVADWVDQAREFAKGDKDLSAFLEKRIEKLSSRGLVYEQGKDLPSVVVEGITFKILWSGVLQPNDVLTSRNVRFDGGKVAGIGFGADGDGFVNVQVFDQSTGDLIRRSDFNSKGGLVAWNPVETRAVTIKTSNLGTRPTKVVLVANW